MSKLSITTMVMHEADWAEAREIAAARGEGGKHSKNTRIWNENQDLVGVIGEMAFADYMGISRDKITRKNSYGDGGVDFWIEIKGKRWSVDVKTAQWDSPPAMFVPEDPKADLFVRAWIMDLEDNVYLTGWKWKNAIISKYNTQVVRGLPAYKIPHKDLLRIAVLRGAVHGLPDPIQTT